MTILFIHLSTHLCRVQLDSLEARLRPVEQPAKRTPREMALSVSA